MKCCNVQDKPSDHTGRNGLNTPPSCTLTRRVQLGIQSGRGVQVEGVGFSVGLCMHSSCTQAKLGDTL